MKGMAILLILAMWTIAARATMAQATQPDPPPPLSSDEILSLVDRENANARQRLGICSFDAAMEFSRTADAVGGASHNHSEVEIVQDDHLRFVHQRTGANTGVIESFAAIAHRSCDIWVIGSIGVERYEFPSLASASPEVRTRMEIWGAPQLDAIGFGTDRQRLSVIRSEFPAGMRWTARAERQGGATVYVLDERFSQQPDKPFRALTADPTKGFLITHVVHYASDGKPGVVLEVEAAQVGTEKMWFPIAAHQVTYRNWASTQPSGGAAETNPPVDTMDITYRNVKVNLPPDAERRFSADSFPLPEGALRFNETATGVDSTSQFRGGRFVALAKWEEQPIFQEAAGKPRPMPTTAPTTTCPSTTPAAYVPPFLVLPPPPPGQRRLEIALEDLHRMGFTEDRIRELGGTLVINGVVGGSIAEKMGLRSGDIIRRVNGKQVRTIQDVIRQVQVPGMVHIEIVRNDKPLTLDETSDMEEGGL
jgi:hypothetical protein